MEYRCIPTGSGLYRLSFNPLKKEVICHEGLRAACDPSDACGPFCVRFPLDSDTRRRRRRSFRSGACVVAPSARTAAFPAVGALSSHFFPSFSTSALPRSFPRKTAGPVKRPPKFISADQNRETGIEPASRFVLHTAPFRCKSPRSSGIPRSCIPVLIPQSRPRPQSVRW